MLHIFVNLKRFEVSRHLGGLCPEKDPQQWIGSVIDDSIRLGLCNTPGVRLTYLLAEGLIAQAVRRRNAHTKNKIRRMSIGCQGVHWEDIILGGNFGAFTSSLPATAAKNLGCTWSIIGHSEERKAKFQVMHQLASFIEDGIDLRSPASKAIDKLINLEVCCALKAGLDVLLCVGETGKERGDGTFEEQMPRIESTLISQLLTGLEGIQDFLNNRRVVIGYEPIWAIGPGRVPPDKEYISFVSSFIKRVVQENFGFDPMVVYGGGLKEENADMIASIDTIGGGLVALTKFTDDIGFEVPELKKIVDSYVSRI